MNVKIYTTPTCHFCKDAKELLNEKNVNFEEMDVSTNTDAKEKMVEISGQSGVPVFDIDGKIIVGFDKNEILEALGITD